MSRSRIALIVSAFALALAGAAGVSSTRAGLSRTSATIDGTPVELITPAGPASAPRPGVIVVHGFSGSRQLMYGVAQTLARNGYAAAVIDLPGHGQNRARFPTQGRGAPGFDRTLTYVMAWLRTVPGVNADQLALVGHSMGAGAVVRFASRDADITATVAISGGGSAGRVQRPSSPRNLLLLAGNWEPAGIRAACGAALTAAYPGAALGQVHGSWADGSARQCLIVPDVEHIGILFSDTAVTAIVRWLDAAFGITPARRDVATAGPGRWALVLHLSAALLLLVLIDRLFRADPDAASRGPDDTQFPHRLPRGAVAIILAVPTLLAALVMRVIPGGWFPLLTADYLCGFYLITGVAIALGLRQLGVPLLGRPVGAGLVGRAVFVAVVALGLFAGVAHHTWLNMWLIAPRLWLAALVFPTWLVYFVAQDRLLRTRPAREYFPGSLLCT
ncbi:MAG: alpha/beta fold hydrolase, partial [Vicinamibacterales bacterium]|nr:alpha/beta fold hydrolase [Vicinamibacterales bacterium]